jgi:RHS repeat-associated protein
VIQEQLVYDPYGRPTIIQGSLSPDFQYAGYYFHAPSGLNLTLARPYSSSLGRWLSRDPIGEGIPSLQIVAPAVAVLPGMLYGQVSGDARPDPRLQSLAVLTGDSSTLASEANMDVVQRLGKPGLNLHSYALNNPINFADPNGSQVWEWALIILLVLAVLGGLYYLKCHTKDNKGSAEQSGQTGPQYGSGQH